MAWMKVFHCSDEKIFYLDKIDQALNATNPVFRTATYSEECLYFCLYLEGCHGTNVKQVNTGLYNCTLITGCLSDIEKYPFIPAPNTNYYSTIRNDCLSLRKSGIHTDGVYELSLDGGTYVKAWCDMTTDGGGWTVIQKRVSNSSFAKTWREYKEGFGDTDNYWIGNDNIHALTTDCDNQLYFNLFGSKDMPIYAFYNQFSVADELSGYKLTLGSYSQGRSNTDYDFFNSDGRKFHTYDNDDDKSCSKNGGKAGWWFRGCHEGNPNGRYLDEYSVGNTWGWGGNSKIKTSLIMVRRKEN